MYPCKETRGSTTPKEGIACHRIPEGRQGDNRVVKIDSFPPSNGGAPDDQAHVEATRLRHLERAEGGGGAPSGSPSRRHPCGGCHGVSARVGCLWTSEQDVRPCVTLGSQNQAQTQGQAEVQGHR